MTKRGKKPIASLWGDERERALADLIVRARKTGDVTDAIVDDIRRTHAEAVTGAEDMAALTFDRACSLLSVPVASIADTGDDRLLVGTNSRVQPFPRYLLAITFHIQQSAVHFEDPKAVRFSAGISLVAAQDEAGEQRMAFAAHCTPIEIVAPIPNGTDHAPFRAPAATA